MIITVTLNAALDRTLRVPNFQRGQRHRQPAAADLAGGKGINVARALSGSRVPVVATGLRAARPGTRIVEELTAEAILNDFVRIGDESRTSTAVVDPTGSRTPRSTSGARMSRPRSSSMLRDKLRYLATAPQLVVFSGSLPRGVEDDFYAEAIRDLNRRGSDGSDSEGEPLRLGRRRAVPRLAEPARGRGLVGQEFHEDEDFSSRSTDRRARGAQRPDHAGVGLLRAAPRGARGEAIPLRRTARRDALSVGRETCCSPGSWLRATRTSRSRRRFGRRSRRSRLDARGRGRPLRPREASRLTGGVEVVELEPVAH